MFLTDLKVPEGFELTIRITNSLERPFHRRVIQIQLDEVGPFLAHGFSDTCRSRVLVPIDFFDRVREPLASMQAHIDELHQKIQDHRRERDAART